MSPIDGNVQVSVGAHVLVQKTDQVTNLVNDNSELRKKKPTSTILSWAELLVIVVQFELLCRCVRIGDMMYRRTRWRSQFMFVFVFGLAF